jgi:hypothetical protein
MPQLRRLFASFSLQQPGLDPNSGHEGYVVDKAALDQVFSKYFSFPCQFSFYQLPHSLIILTLI